MTVGGAAAVAPDVDDHRIAAGKEAHRLFERGGALRPDPHEAVIGQIADVAWQQPELGDAVIGGADLALEAARIGLPGASARRQDRRLGWIVAEVEVAIAAGRVEIGVDPLGELDRIGERVAARSEAPRKDASGRGADRAARSARR